MKRRHFFAAIAGNPTGLPRYEALTQRCPRPAPQIRPALFDRDYVEHPVIISLLISDYEGERPAPL